MLLRFRSTPHALREDGSLRPYSAPVIGFVRGCQKFAAFALSVSFPPSTQWLVRFRRCCPKLCIEKCAPSGLDDGRMKMSRLSTRRFVAGSMA